ncbi:Holliday junction resolvase RuvX [Candidatus Mycalebacterium sp.]
MKFLALDVGTKTIGVAVSDELGITSNGLGVIKRKDEKTDLKSLAVFIEEHRPARVVVGIPFNSDGSLGKRAKNIKKFSEILKEFFGIETVLWDESFSTVQAEKTLIGGGMGRGKRKKVVDKLAAVIILREYLDSLEN